MTRVAPFFAALILCAAGVGGAKEAVPMAEDAALEARLVGLASELRCLVCQNQTLADSDAELAEDLRREIRDMMRQGSSDAEIVEFLTQRYGDFIRYRPRLDAKTILLWFGPLIMVVAGGGALVATLRRRETRVPEVPLSAEERWRLEELLRKEAV